MAERVRGLTITTPRDRYIKSPQLPAMSDGSNANVISRNFGLKFGEALALVQAGGPNTDRLLQIARDNFNPSPAVDHKQEGNFISFPLPPTQPKKLPTPDYLSTVLKLYDTKRIDGVIRPREWKKPYTVMGEPRAATNVLKYVNMQLDKIALAIVRNILGDTEANDKLELARNSIMTSGNQRALLKRLIKNATSNPAKPEVGWHVDLLVWYTITRPKEEQFPNKLSETAYVPNWRSSAGMPYPPETDKIDVISPLLLRVNELFKMFQGGMTVIKAYIKANPSNYTVLIRIRWSYWRQ